MSEDETWCPCGDSKADHRYLCGGKLHADLDKLFATEAGADCTFVLPEGEIKAHKIILSARVEVFERMFSSNCTESQTNRVAITDCDLSSFKAFLNYVYCGVLHRPFDLYNLLSLTSKYMLPELVCACVPALKTELGALTEPYEAMAFAEKMMKLAKTCDISIVTYLCEDALIERLNDVINGESTITEEDSLDYVTDLLILSHEQNGTRLKEKCLEYFNDEDCTVTFRSGRYGRMNAYPTLLAQLTG